MTVNILSRLWRISMGSAITLSVPVVVLSAWCAWRAYADLDVYRRVASPDRKISLDDFQLSFHDMLTAWSQNLFSWSPSNTSALPNFKLHLKNLQLQTIVSEHSGRGKYVDAVWSRGNKNIRVKVRQRGHKHWHHLGAQHSLKVRFGKDGGGLGLKAVALINEPTPLVITNALIADVAKNYGLLCPEPDFVRVWLNGADMGVYRRQIMADEALLRRNNRYPCNLYSGDLDEDQPTRTLWTTPAEWKKSAWCNGDKESNNDLASLLDHVSSDSFQEFHDYAYNELDMERFATLDALEIVFGINQRDWRQGHKLVHEDGGGKWEPVAWSLRGFFDTDVFKPSNNPLGIRLEMVPGYLSLRNRILHRMLTGEARPAAIRNSALDFFKTLIPQLMTGANWDAFELTPNTDRFLYKMLRPMAPKKLALSFDSTMTTYAIRHAYLLSELEHPGVTTQACPGDHENSWPFQVTIPERVGVAVESIQLWFKDRKKHPWLLEAAGNRIQNPLKNAVMIIPKPLELLPSVELVKNPSSENKYDPLTTRPLPVSYIMKIRSDFAPRNAKLLCRNLATGAGIILNVDFSSQHASSTCRPSNTIHAKQVPSMKEGQRSAHPWSYSRTDEIRELIVGPGDVPITHTMIYGANQKVKILPGTRFLMAKGTSLVFMGQVQLRGTREKPVILEPGGRFKYGGLVLHGINTAGSRIEWLRSRGASSPVLFGQRLRGSICINNTRGIVIQNCSFKNNSSGVDLVHASNVSDLNLRHVTISKSSQDALDLEFCQANITDLIVVESKDEAIDLMGSTVKIIDSILSSVGGSAISAGERSHVTIQGSILYSAKTGLMIKHDSSVLFLSSLIHKCRTGVMVKAASRYYPQGSRLDAQNLTITNCGTNFVVEKRQSPGKSAKINLSNVLYFLDNNPFTEHLLKDLLGATPWSHLAGTIEELAAKENPP